MTTLGKVLGGGFPLAAFVGKEEIMKMVAPSGKVYQAGTYSGNPISVAAALATLKVLQAGGKGFYDEMASKCRALVTPLKKTIEDANLKLQINHLSSMFQLFFTGSPVYDYLSVKKSDSTKFMAYHAKLLAKGVFIPPSQFETCFISAAHNEEDIRKTVGIIEGSLQETLK
jgi:glutamate-1-semialdehyde 2,1-aminomutase